TIYALSSAPGRGALAVIRISGPASDMALKHLMMRDELPPARKATLTSLTAPNGELLDRGLVLRFQAPLSFTGGEDCAELHLHGSPAVVHAVQDALRELRLRPAEAGEFARRAFDAGKLDLTQARAQPHHAHLHAHHSAWLDVEGLADLLAADTESQRRQALLHSTAHLTVAFPLPSVAARLEAVIDFGEDEGIAEDVAAGVLPLVCDLRQQLEGHLASAASGELVRTGVRIAIVGPPNAGKSSLLNLLAGQEAAIVSPAPGTTRDVVQVQLELGGVKVILIDSAGLRQTDCPIEAEGVRRAVAAAHQAHIVLHLADATSGAAADGVDSRGQLADVALPLPAQIVQLWVMNKADLVPGCHEAAGATVPPAPHLLVSCKSGQGIDQLLALLQQHVRALVASGGDGGMAGALVTRARHKRTSVPPDILVALQHLEVQCEEVRAAARALGRVTGAIDTAMVLDSLFCEFCIGK
ncbi:hypothetical protein CHLNCDRAFT_8246, partial [Chlorella variabilis]